MPKWIGNRFGNSPVGVTTFYVSAVHKLWDQYYAKQSNGWKEQPFTASGGSTWTASQGGNTYTYHAFTSSSDFTVLTGVKTVEALIVAGGGGGGAGRDGGGGGAGGFRVVTSDVLAPGPYSIVVGAGGAGMPYYPGYSSGDTHSSGARGNSSTAFGYVSTGGGARTGPSGPHGQEPGGSGAGSAFSPPISFGVGNSPPVSPPQGNPGGAGGYVYPGPEPGFGCGGGGGAGGVGGNALIPGPYATGDGGIGTRSDSISPLAWSIPASYGTPGPSPGRYFAGGGGGGGGTFNGTPGGGNGGSGGGGSKGFGGGSGTSNTGGGGGGGNFQTSNNYAGGNGGSGIVIIRYISS